MQVHEQYEIGVGDLRPTEWENDTPIEWRSLSFWLVLLLGIALFGSLLVFTTVRDWKPESHHATAEESAQR